MSALDAPGAFGGAGRVAREEAHGTARGIAWRAGRVARDEDGNCWIRVFDPHGSWREDCERRFEVEIPYEALLQEEANDSAIATGGTFVAALIGGGVWAVVIASAFLLYNLLA